MSRLKKRPKIEQDDQRKNKHQSLGNEQISSSSASNLQKCPICHRRFTGDRLVDHQRACKSSTSSSHRYHYNSQLHRWKDLDYHINAKHSQFQSPKISWREKHQQLQDAIKGQYHATDRPYQCSQCLRKFATENAVTKHRKGCSNKRQLNVKTRDLKNKKSKTF